MFSHPSLYEEGTTSIYMPTSHTPSIPRDMTGEEVQWGHATACHAGKWQRVDRAARPQLGLKRGNSVRDLVMPAKPRLNICTNLLFCSALVRGNEILQSRKLQSSIKAKHLIMWDALITTTARIAGDTLRTKLFIPSFDTEVIEYWCAIIVCCYFMPASPVNPMRARAESFRFTTTL